MGLAVRDRAYLRRLVGLLLLLSLLGGTLPLVGRAADVAAPAHHRQVVATRLVGLDRDLRSPRLARDQPHPATAPAPAPPAAPRASGPSVVAAGPPAGSTIRVWQPPMAQVAWDRPHQNYVDAPAANLAISLGVYTDCTGSTPLGSLPARDWCPSSDLVYLVGHNPGAFTPLLRLHPGDLIRYWDPNGAMTTYRLDHVDQVQADQGGVYMEDTSRPHLTLQTCVDPSGSRYWMFVAYPA
jgi:hypothetical protein